MSNHTTLADFIWKNADDLWGDFKHVEFGKIILPFTLLRRLECVLEPTRETVLQTVKGMDGTGVDLDLILRTTTKFPFYNTSQYALDSLGGTRTRQNLEDYIAKFSDNARVIFEQFDFVNTISRLDKAGLLYKICQNFASIDLHPNAVPDRVMSNVYEHLIRRFGAEVNEAAEDFMTPRDVVHLATTLLLDPDDQLFEANPGLIRTIYDPTCGTGGFLTDAMDHVDALRNRTKIAPVLVPYGQELEPETHAVALTSMLLRTLESDPGRDLSKNIKKGSTLSEDGFPYAMEAILTEQSLRDKSFGVIIDEAHASQTGTTASKLQATLAMKSKEAMGEMTIEELLSEMQRSRVRPKNVSQFAFTATPKHSTLTLFGRLAAYLEKSWTTEIENK